MGLFDRFSFGPSLADFAASVVAEMQRVGMADARYEPGKSRVLSQGGELDVARRYSDHCKLPTSERVEHIRKLVAVFALESERLPDNLDDAKANFRPLVEMSATIAFWKLEKLSWGLDHYGNRPEHSVGSHLVGSVAYHFPTTIRYLTRNDLERWGLTYYDALEIGCQNLGQVGVNLKRFGEGLYSVMMCDHFDASRLLLTRMINQLEVKGEPIAMLPSEHILMITGSEDSEGLEIMVSLAEAAIEDPMCPIPVRLDGEQWSDWMPPMNCPLFDRFHLLELKFLDTAYALQKSMVERLYEAQGVNTLLITHSVVSKDNGPSKSTCEWTEGGDILLPKTDFVLFSRNGKGIVAGGPWDRVRELVGDLMEVEDIYPPRWSVRGFPTNEQLQVINQEMK